MTTDQAKTAATTFALEFVRLNPFTTPDQLRAAALEVALAMLQTINDAAAVRAAKLRIDKRQQELHAQIAETQAKLDALPPKPTPQQPYTDNARSQLTLALYHLRQSLTDTR
jgi:hypothetical protein